MIFSPFLRWVIFWGSKNWFWIWPIFTIPSKTLTVVVLSKLVTSNFVPTTSMDVFPEVIIKGLFLSFATSNNAWPFCNKTSLLFLK